MEEVFDITKASQVNKVDMQVASEVKQIRDSHRKGEEAKAERRLVISFPVCRSVDHKRILLRKERFRWEFSV